MAKHFTVKTNEHTGFFEEGEFTNTHVIDQLYIRKLICLTKSKNWHIKKTHHHLKFSLQLVY